MSAEEYLYGVESLGSGPVVVAGERLGAGLAAALLIRLRDAGARLPHGAVLVSALLDLSLEAPSLLLNEAADPTFQLAELRRHAARYAAGTAPTDPLLSPLHANLHGLPRSSCSRRATTSWSTTRWPSPPGQHGRVSRWTCGSGRTRRSCGPGSLRTWPPSSGNGRRRPRPRGSPDRAGAVCELGCSRAGFLGRLGSLAGWSGKRRLRDVCKVY
ncbi:MAG TPA: alpha/beta hydrolase fold domain-containing protein [Streptosporangiaceae bacterium]|nr:alpha/beta hydrolase fold domain-containing protein [Streptosporangiaceae bacterium]